MPAVDWLSGWRRMNQWTLIVPATLLGLVPLLAVAVLRPKGSAWWWLAAAFGVSFVADVASMAVGHSLISQTYPLLQAGLFALVLAPRPMAVGVITVVAVVSAVSLGWRGAAGLDLWLHVVAWGSIAAVAWLTLADTVLRTTLVVGFAGLAAAWVLFRVDPSLTAWTVLQGVRLATAAGFAWAVWDYVQQREPRDAP